MAIIHTNETSFQHDVLEVKGTVLVDFWASWCGPCRMLSPVLEEFAANHPDISVAKVNVDENMALAAAFHVESIPTVLVVRDGQIVNKSIGYVSLPELEKLI